MQTVCIEKNIPVPFMKTHKHGRPPKYKNIPWSTLESGDSMLTSSKKEAMSVRAKLRWLQSRNQFLGWKIIERQVGESDAHRLWFVKI